MPEQPLPGAVPPATLYHASVEGDIALEPDTTEDRKILTDSLTEYNKPHLTSDDHEPLNISVRGDEIA